MTERRRCRKAHKTRWGGPACTGHKSAARGGACCTNSPRRGQSVCGYHGGNAGQNKAAAERRTAEQAAAKAMRRFGGPLDTTPTEALLDTVKWTAGYVAWLRDKVSEISSDRQLVWGVVREKTGGDDRGVTRQSGANVWLVMLGEWSDRLVKVCTEAIKAGIEERRVRLAESQGQLVADVIKAILADLNLTPAQQADVAEVVPRHLRLLVS